MGTRNTVALRLPDGKIKAIYVNLDGHPHYAGKILSENYQEKEKATALVEKGNYHSIHPEMEKIEFWSVEDGSPEVFEDIETWLTRMGNRDTEYAYLYDTQTNTEEKWIRYGVWSKERCLCLTKVTEEEAEQNGSYCLESMGEEEYYKQVLRKGEVA